MNIVDIRALLAWADRVIDNDAFWRRIWCAAEAYPLQDRERLHALVAMFGIVPVAVPGAWDRWNSR